jgi:hypothetical protein
MICTALEMQVMTPELFERYKNVKSSKGFTLSNAIQVPPAPPFPLSRSLSRASAPSLSPFPLPRAASYSSRS